MRASWFGVTKRPHPALSRKRERGSSTHFTCTVIFFDTSGGSNWRCAASPKSSCSVCVPGSRWIVSSVWRLAVVLVRRVVRNRRIERRQLLPVDQKVMVTRVRRRVAGGLDRDALRAELYRDVLADRRAVLRRDDRRLSRPAAPWSAPSRRPDANARPLPSSNATASKVLVRMGGSPAWGIAMIAPRSRTIVHAELFTARPSPCKHAAPWPTPIHRPASLVYVFRRLWPQIWRYRAARRHRAAFLIVAKLANIGVPLVLKQLVDALDIAPKPLLIPLAAAGRVRRAAAVDFAVPGAAPDRVRARDGAHVAPDHAARVRAPARAVAALPSRPPHRRRRARRRARHDCDVATCSTGRSTRSCRRCSKSASSAAILIVRYDWGFAAITLATLAALYRVHVLGHRMAPALLPRGECGRHRSERARGRFAAELRNRQVLRQRAARVRALRRQPRQVRGSDGQEPEDARRAQHRPGRHRRDRPHAAALARVGRRRRRHDEPRRSGARQRVPDPALDSAELPRHRLSRGQAGADQHRAHVRAARGGARSRGRAGRAAARAAAAARCASSTSISTTTRRARSCATSISRFRPARPSPSSARPAPASRRWRGCCSASTTSAAGASRSTARTSAR